MPALPPDTPVADDPSQVAALSGPGSHVCLRLHYSHGHIAIGIRVDIQSLAEPHREQRAMQAMLKGSPTARTVARHSAAITSAARTDTTQPQRGMLHRHR